MDLIIRIAPSPVWLAFRHEPGFGLNYLGKHGTGFSGQFTKLPSLRRLELSRSRSGSGRFRSIRLIRFPFVF